MSLKSNNNFYYEDFMAGWVYILSNPSMPDLLKIGYTEKDPKSRAKEISQDTGVPSEFVVDYQVYSSRPYDLEQKTHSVLYKYRINNNREFFRCSHEIAIEAIKQAISILGLNNDPSTGLEIYHKLDRQKIEIELEKNKKHRELEYLLSQQENLKRNVTVLKEINSELSSKNERYREENLKIRKRITSLKENYLSNLGKFKIKLERRKEVLKNDLILLNNQLICQSDLNHTLRNEVNLLIEKYNELKQKLETKKKNKELKKKISELENKKSHHIKLEKERYDNLVKEVRKKIILRIFFMPLGAITLGFFASMILGFIFRNLNSESNLNRMILFSIIFLILGIVNNIRGYRKYIDYLKRELNQKNNVLEQEYNIQQKSLENQIIKEN